LVSLQEDKFKIELRKNSMVQMNDQKLESEVTRIYQLNQNF